jgi:1-deoxy-D-xylulose-5-phosphate synthase
VGILRRITGPPDKHPLLSSLRSPSDLRGLPITALPTLATELREFLVHSVSAKGGHLAAGLGTAELTIALHYVFDTPHDRLVWRAALKGT